MTTAAIVGCGDVSIIHTEALAVMDEVRLVGVRDPHPHRRSSAAQAYGVPGFPDQRSLLDAVRPDLVHICIPHNQHASLAIDCLDRGVNVIVEKPLAHSIEVVTEKAILALRGDLTVSYADGRTEVVAERKAPSGGRAYWGVSHELLIRDFCARIGDDEPFWISPRKRRSPCASSRTSTHGAT